MTKSEYTDYQAAVAAFFEGEGLDCLSSGSIHHDYDGPCTCDDHMHDSNGDYQGETYFSWSPCDCCQRPLGGNHEDYIGYNPTTKQIQGDYSICDDCVYYNEYGKLDDMTMMDMEAED